MAINNFLCRTCNHSLVCEMCDKKISVFSQEAKKQLGIDITINKCLNYDSTGETVVSEFEVDQEESEE